jgi:LEA14-like dessication related protein
MKNAVKIYLTTISIRNPNPIRIAIRNILFALLLSALYLLGRQYYRNHTTSVDVQTKIDNIKEK